MPEILSLLAAIVVVCLFVWHHFRRRDLPPKARLICDIWKEIDSVEREEKPQYTAVELTFNR